MTSEDKIKQFTEVNEKAEQYATNEAGHVNLIQKRAFLEGFNFAEKYFKIKYE